MTLTNDPNVVAYYPGTIGSGTTLKDYSGNGNDGTITGATWKKKVDGLYYLNFDGSTDDIALSNGVFDTSGDSSLCFWFNLDSNSASSQYFFDGKHTSLNYRFAARIRGTGDSYSNQVDVFVTNTGGANEVISTSEPVSGVWEFWCIIYDNSDGTIQLYRNTVQETLAADVSGSSGTRTGLINCKIGEFYSGGSNFNGGIANFIIINTKLTLPQIKDIYRKTYIL